MAIGLNVSLDDGAVNRMDKLVGKHGFASRDDVIAAALTELFRCYIETVPFAEQVP